MNIHPSDKVNLGLELVNVEGKKCKIGFEMQFGRFPMWTSTTYDEIEFVNDSNGHYHHSGWIECTQLNHLIQHTEYYPNIFDARQG